MTVIDGRGIAEHYLPSRYHYWYARSKLAMDPLYAAARRALSLDRAPLLDVGCGIGLLAMSLDARADADYLGVDIDAEKVGIARSAAARAGLQRVRFEVKDLAAGFPRHRGSVAILDVVQYLAPAARDRLLESAAECVTPEGTLVMRVGLDDQSWRASITHIADKVGHLSRWMRTAPQRQPTRQGLTDILARHGLRCQFTSLSGRMPFNNWLVIGRR